MKLLKETLNMPTDLQGYAVKHVCDIAVYFKTDHYVIKVMNGIVHNPVLLRIGAELLEVEQ